MDNLYEQSILDVLKNFLAITDDCLEKGDLFKLNTEMNEISKYIVYKEGLYKNKSNEDADIFGEDVDILSGFKKKEKALISFVADPKEEIKKEIIHKRYNFYARNRRTS